MLLLSIVMFGAMRGVFSSVCPDYRMIPVCVHGMKLFLKGVTRKLCELLKKKWIRRIWSIRSLTVAKGDKRKLEVSYVRRLRGSVKKKD